MAEEFKFVLKLSGPETLCINEIGRLVSLEEGAIIEKSRHEAMEEARRRARKLIFMLHPIDARKEYIIFSPFISRFEWSLYQVRNPFLKILAELTLRLMYLLTHPRKLLIFCLEGLKWEKLLARMSFCQRKRQEPFPKER